MNFTLKPYRVTPSCILTIKFITFTIILLGGQTVFTQAPQAERTFPTQDNPRIIITHAYGVSITTWDKDEVSVVAQVSGTAAPPDAINIKHEKTKLEIKCESSNPNVSLTLRVPSKAVLEIRSDGNKVEIKEPSGKITVGTSKNVVVLNVPESSALDMTDAPNATEQQQIRTASVRTGIGKRRSGSGPPFVKVTAATAQVFAARGAVPPVNLFTRNPTLAATTIARRTSSMSRALRKSNPQLMRPRRDESPTAKRPDQEEGALKLETHLINLNVSATDNAGKAIPDLKREDFTVYEDGVKQQITFFSPERSSFNLVLLIDLSGSMKDEMELIKETALHFLDVISAEDNVAVVTFTTDVTVVSHLTKDREDLRESIDWMLAPAGGTAFYDALGYVLVEEFRKVKVQRNAVIAITDGEDNVLQATLIEKLRPGWYRGPINGSFLTFEELLDGATESDALIYPIHLNPTPPQPVFLGNPNPPPNPRPDAPPPPPIQVQPELTEIATKQLNLLAQASGARFYHANRIDDLKGVFDQVAAELRTVYSMAYTPTNLNYDGRFRKIRVHVNRPDVVTRTRPGYYGR